MAKMTEYIITPAPQVCFQMLYLFLKLQNKDKKNVKWPLFGLFYRKTRISY